MKKMLGFLMLVLSLLIAGCNSRSSLSGTEEPKVQQTKGIQAEEEAGTQTKAETTKLTWALFDFGADISVCQKALNEELKNKNLPFEIEFVNVPVGFDGNYQEYVDSYIKAVEEGGYDIINCPGVMNCYDIYKIAIDRELLAPLDELLEGGSSTGVQLKSAYPSIVWESLKENGQIYGVLTPYTNFKYYAVFNMDYAEKYEVSVSDITFTDMEAILQKVKKGEEENTSFVVSTSWPYYLAGQSEYTLCSLIGINTANETPVAENILYNDTYLKQIECLNNWGAKGFFPDADMDYWKQMEDGNFFVTGIYSYSETAAENDCRNNLKISPEFELQAVEMPEFENVFYGNGAKTGVNAKSQNKKEAINALAEIYSDADLSDALIYGKEGEDYIVQDGLITRMEDQEILGLLAKETLGNSFITSPENTDSKSKRDELWETVENLKPSKQIGFRYDLSEIHEKISELNQLFEEKYHECFYGNSKDWNIDLARLRDEAGSLGIDEVVSEMNNQLERNRK
jgi:hypothetical protein